MFEMKLVLLFLAFATSAVIAFNATEDVYYVLYTQDNPSGTVLSANSSNLASSSFNATNPTRVYIHGWDNNHISPLPIKIKNAYLQKGKFNVILVDWSALALDPDYFVAKAGSQSVATAIASFLNFLVSSNAVNLSKLVMSGHSLGAHIAGFVGKQISGIYGIVGLDPAGPGFSISDPSSTRLASSDATIVQVIHTTATAGFWYTIGKSDFFMNSGWFNMPPALQPGCSATDSTMGQACSHGRAADFYAESINSFRFVGSGGTYMGGEPLATNAVGNYYLKTNAQSPFAKG